MKRNLIRVGIVVVAILFICTNYCFATGIESTKLVTGTKNLITDLTNWLLVLAPTVTVVLVGYYLIRRSGSDDMDGKRWDSRIKIAIVCCIGVVVASGLINALTNYYK